MSCGESFVAPFVTATSLVAISRSFHKIVHTLVAEMGEAYAELRDNEDRIVAALKQEEAQFAKTLDAGMKVLEDAVSSLTSKTLPGELIFRLYDTHGFPVDLTNDNRA